jgi:CBS domain-containing protein
MDPNLSISEIMTHDLITVAPNDSLAKVNSIFVEFNIHHIPVIDKGNRLAGMITKEDLLRLTSVRPEFSDRAFEKIAVKDIMTTRLVTLEAEDTVGLAADIFLANEFHAIPVLEEERLTGIVTTYDLIKYAFKTPFNEPLEEGQVSIDEMNQ